MAEEDPNVKDILIALYTQNEQYHNIKERVVWLAGIVYFTFSVFVLRWIPHHEDIWAEGKCLSTLTMAFLTLLFIVTIVFIIRQTKEKIGTVVITKNLRCLISDLDKKSTEPYKTLIKQTCPKEAKKKALFFREGWSGVLVLAAVLIFYSTQVVFLYGGTDNKIQLLCGFGIAIGLSLIGWFLNICLVELELAKKKEVSRPNNHKMKPREWIFLGLAVIGAAAAVLQLFVWCLLNERL